MLGHAWLPADQLQAGDFLATHDGKWVRVDSVDATEVWGTVYNLRVQKDHTYFVGKDEWGFSVWAHNSNYTQFVDDLRAKGVLDPENVPAHKVLLDRGDLRILFEQGTRTANQGSDPSKWLVNEIRRMTKGLQTDVRLYRDTPIPDVVEREDPRLVVDMPFVGRGEPGTNAAGWMRNAGFYWDKVLRRFPEAFNDYNVRVLAGDVPGRVAPVNNSAFRAVFTQYDVVGLIGNALVHHHIGGGGQAVAIPAGLHPGSGGIHNIERAWGIWQAEDPVAAFIERLR